MFKLIKEKILNLITKKTKIEFVSFYEYIRRNGDYVICKKTIFTDYYGKDYIFFKKNNLYTAKYFGDKAIGLWSSNLEFFQVYNIGDSEFVLTSRTGSKITISFKEYFKSQLEPHIILEKKCNIF